MHPVAAQYEPILEPTPIVRVRVAPIFDDQRYVRVKLAAIVCLLVIGLVLEHLL